MLNYFFEFFIESNFYFRKEGGIKKCKLKSFQLELSKDQVHFAFDYSIY